jgi:hypothetical protein
MLLVYIQEKETNDKKVFLRYSKLNKKLIGQIN